MDLIRFFMERHEAKIQAKSKTKLRDYLNMMERLIKFWHGKTVYQINEKTIAEYQKKARPGKPLAATTTLRELAELKSIINFGIQKGLCELRGHIIDWELPPPPEPRMTFYTRSEVAKLVWTAYRRKNMAMGRPGVGIYTSKHIARFLLIAVKTGTRSERIETASFKNLPDRPWIDLENGIFYRAGVANKSPVNKRADPVRISDDLLSHLRRWAKEGDDVVRSPRGVGSTRKGFFNLKHEVFTKDRAKVVNRHTCKHTCASWLMQKRVPLSIIASYLSTTEEVILKHYGHFSPDFHQEINDARKEARSEIMKKAAAAKKKAIGKGPALEAAE
ncbi:hypothetical protein LCM4573_06190 [Rhizobium sp. LCM 4573]|nr:hypothetical protein LCM4573_06190 [Rhizobium sp. LCM 4573]